MHRPPSPSSRASAWRRCLLLRGTPLVWLVVVFPPGLPPLLRRRLRLLSHPSVHWLGISPPLVVPLAGALASAIATCQTGLPTTDALLKQRHLCHPQFNLIVAFLCNSASIPTAKPSIKCLQVPTLPYFLELYRISIFRSVLVSISWYLPYRYQR
jgi:hypothetical protein